MNDDPISFDDAADNSELQPQPTDGAHTHTRERPPWHWWMFGLIVLTAVGFVAYLVFVKNPKHRLTRRGMQMKKELYDSIKVYQKLDTAKLHLPLAVSLAAYCPRRLNQGDQNSCVGWATAYAARSILEAQATHADPNSLAFSPSYIYNQVHLADCEGSYMPVALAKLANNGLLSLDEFPYSDETCDRLPSEAQKLRATRYRITGFSRLTKNIKDAEGNFAIDTVSVKQMLAAGSPVIIGAIITTSFDSLRQAVWQPTPNDVPLGGHAMCVVGYNDTLAGGGAFMLMNSWGEEWADKGMAWVRYRDFVGFCKEAYAIDPLPQKATERYLKLQIALQNARNNRPIRWATAAQKRLWHTAQLTRRTRLKLNITNETPCYLYIFGERGGRVRLLFPHTTTLSPYLGITGSRVFPRESLPNSSAFAQQNYLAIVASKTPIDAYLMQAQLRRNRRLSFAQRLKKILRPTLIAQPHIARRGGILQIVTDTAELHTTVLTVFKVRR